MRFLVHWLLHRLYPNVIGTADGLKWTRGELTDLPAVIVLVSRKVPKNELAPSQIIPKAWWGQPTDVIEVGGEFVAHRAEFFNPRLRYRPLRPGTSVGGHLGTGTLGWFVRDRVTNGKLGLTNAHVVGDVPGKHVYQPGPRDGPMTRSNQVGRVLVGEYPSFWNSYVDAAVFALQPVDVGFNDFPEGPVLDWQPARVGDRVWKWGATSGKTTGRVLAVNVASRVRYPDKSRAVRGQLLCSVGSRPGDSGSLVVRDDLAAVGLLFAGTGAATLATPIRRVLAVVEAKA